MKKILFAFLLLANGLMQQAQAQNRSVSGKVTDRATNEGLPGVTVVVKGQPTIGTSTNADGSFSISGVPDNAQTLVMSYVGFASQEVSIAGVSNVTVALGADTKQLNEVVVTALGIERTRNSLAYSATTVTGSDITIARNPNAINGLSGKVAGLAITQTNTLGGSSNVVIRGTKSLTGNNQALFVVDGVPISNANTNSGDQATGRSGYDYGNAAADLNPDDIATTTVLKGAAASALYGERAANGVIIITTKKGRKGLGVTINSGITVGKFDKSTFIKYQNKYGAGYGKYYGDASGYFNTENPDGSGRLVAPTSEDASYGARFDPNLNVLQWGAYTLGSPTYGQATPWVAAANGPSSIFQTAVSTLNSVIVDGGNDNGTFKLGYTNNVERGILPNSQVTKNIINLGASYNITPRLTTSATINFTRLIGVGRYGTGYGSENLMTNFRQWYQTNVDMKDLKDAYDRSGGGNATWNFASPETGDLSPIYWNNPYFVRYKNFENDSRYRTFGNVMTTYKVTDWFNVLGRVTMDSYDEQQEERSAVGSTASSYPSYYRRFNRTYREFNFDLIGNFQKKFGEDISFQGLLGANMRRQYTNSIDGSTLGGMVVSDLYTLTNSKSGNNLEEYSASQAVDGIFASTTFGFRDRVFLDLTIRQDRASTLPKANNAYVYPAASLGYVFSESLRDVAPWLSYGKARINYAQVGAAGIPYLVNNVYRKPQAFGAIPLFAVNGSKNNQDLKPELTKSIEIGVETAFLDNRVGVEVNAYQQNTINQIFRVDVSTASGFNSRAINSGEVRNRGLEITGFVVPVKNESFTWRVGANWAKNVNQVLSLYEGLDNIVLATYQGGITSNARVGQPYGILTGTDFVYKNGQRVVGANGYYTQSGPNENIANPNAKWRGGLTNTIAYKGISLNVLIDTRIGGQVFSLDRYYGLATGLQEETAGLNDLGNESRLPIAQGGGIILDGILADGTPNKKRVSNTNFGLYGYRRNPNAAFVYDASFVKLREVSLSYAIPTAITARMGFVKGIDFSIVGRNLAILYKNLPDADPEESLGSGNLGQGYQSGSYPVTRTVGANVRLSF